jgi:hypothetical protein
VRQHVPKPGASPTTFTFTTATPALCWASSFFNRIFFCFQNAQGYSWRCKFSQRWRCKSRS